MAVYKPPATLVREQQIQCWGYYGAYGAVAAAAGAAGAKCVSNIEAVGEVRYIVGWAADQMSRMQWDVMVDGSADWELELADGQVVRSSAKEGDKSHNLALSLIHI